MGCVRQKVAISISLPGFSATDKAQGGKRREEEEDVEGENEEQTSITWYSLQWQTTIIVMLKWLKSTADYEVMLMMLNVTS